MLRDRYEPTDLLAHLSAPGMQLDPVLTELDGLLDDDTLFKAIKHDLASRHPRTLLDGRPSTPVEVILRLLVIKHLYGWSYDQTCQLVSGSLVLRQFSRVYLEAVPTDTTLLRWANLISPATLHQLHDHIVDVAYALKVTRGRKLRIDGTVVETNIHYPVDSTTIFALLTFELAHRVLCGIRDLLQTPLIEEIRDASPYCMRRRTAAPVCPNVRGLLQPSAVSALCDRAAGLAAMPR